jgi:hypothetical protein
VTTGDRADFAVALPAALLARTTMRNWWPRSALRIS